MTAAHPPERGGPLLLAIESSCDETAAAVLDGTRSLLSSAVDSQVALHALYGGVVPELASRSHALAITRVVQQALDEAGVTLADISAMAVTEGPGLVGSILVGIEFAKGLALARNLPMVGVHHLEGHLFAPFLQVAEGFDEPAFPCVALIVSGGHTSLYHCEGPGSYQLLGRTLDDAAGEAYDKVAKMAGLGYPGGPIVDRMAALGDPKTFDFPRPMWRKGNLDFSFSGIKTAVSHAVRTIDVTDEKALCGLLASFQASACDVLAGKAFLACQAAGVRQLIVTGGVACNAELRRRLQRLRTEKGLRVSIPPPALCTDNAAMIGAAGYARAWARVQAGEGFTSGSLNARSTWPLAPLPASVEHRTKVRGA